MFLTTKIYSIPSKIIRIFSQKEFGEDGDWKEAAKATRIVIYKGFDLYNETKWEEAYAWFVENAIKTKRVFKKME
ncbi:MAG: DUF4268 domain-containing protein [Bacteroidaceae bacterium]|nr:DUF4268 domain-containing protein [Bacteroidaceae bacterium]